MSGLEIKAAMLRLQAIRDLGDPSHSVSKSGGDSLVSAHPARDLTEGVAESPRDFRGPGSFRTGQSIEQEVSEFPVIDPACQATTSPMTTAPWR